MEDKAKKTKTMVGVVVSDKMDKSRTIMIERIQKHPLYGKYIKKRSKFMFHDPNNETKVGDVVMVSESKPVSKHKRWVFAQVVTKTV